MYYKFIYGDDYCEDNNYKKNIVTYHKSLNHSKKISDMELKEKAEAS